MWEYMYGTWKTINDILNQTKKKHTFPRFFRDEDNNIITGKMQIANKFNNCFASIGSNLARQIKSPRDKSFKKYLTKNIIILSNFHDINEDTINSIIVKLWPKTSFGFDGLSTKLIKIIKPVFVRPPNPEDWQKHVRSQVRPPQFLVSFWGNNTCSVPERKHSSLGLWIQSAWFNIQDSRFKNVYLTNVLSYICVSTKSYIDLFVYDKVNGSYIVLLLLP